MRTSLHSILATIGAALLLASYEPVRADIFYVSNGGNNTIERFTSGGVGSLFTAMASSPTGLAFDSAGNLYVATQSSIEMITPGGVHSVFASGSLKPSGLAFDAAGNLYVANQFLSLTGATVERFTSQGIRSVFADSSDGISIPQGIAFDSGGNLYVSNKGNDEVIKFTPDAVGTVFADHGDGLQGPYGLAFDIAGNLYAASSIASNRVYKFAPDGSLLTSFPTGGSPRVWPLTARVLFT